MPNIKNIFTQPVVDELVGRIEQLNNQTTPQWGKMSVGQMLAHVNVAYEMAFEKPPAKHNFFMRFIMMRMIKPIVVGPKPYKKNSRTAPAFKQTTEKDFNVEKERLFGYLKKTVDLGEKHFDGKVSNSFGPLTIKEWNTLFYKHLDHHLSQFGV
ncbi:MAG: DUF1569 domain-containing protein [Bacteroidota bacterium]